MALPSTDEFKQMVLDRPAEDLVEEYLFGGEVYAFREWPEAASVLEKHLCSKLRLESIESAVVGSAKLGFSLKPYQFGSPFSDRSDIDIVIVSGSLFDRVWHSIVKSHYPKRDRFLPREEWNWWRERQEDVYWGWFNPARIGTIRHDAAEELEFVRNLSQTWHEARHTLSNHSEFPSQDVRGRLYRTWHHALMYHVNGLQIVRKNIVSRREG